MSCPKDREQLSAYFDGELSAGEAEALRAHLEDCADCRAELDALRAAARALSALPAVSAPDDLKAKILAAVEAEAETTGSRSRSAWVRAFWPTAAVVAIAVGLMLYGDHRRPSATQVSRLTHAEKRRDDVFRAEGEAVAPRRDEKGLAPPVSAPPAPTGHTFAWETTSDKRELNRIAASEPVIVAKPDAAPQTPQPQVFSNLAFAEKGMADEEGAAKATRLAGGAVVAPAGRPPTAGIWCIASANPDETRTKVLALLKREKLAPVDTTTPGGNRLRRGVSLAESVDLQVSREEATRLFAALRKANLQPRRVVMEPERLAGGSVAVGREVEVSDADAADGKAKDAPLAVADRMKKESQVRRRSVGAELREAELAKPVEPLHMTFVFPVIVQPAPAEPAKP